MKFRPCIDIHNGKVKQLVGGTLKDKGNKAQENFVSQKGGAYYANMYKNNNLEGGHIIILNAADSEYFEASKKQALEALAAYPEGMQIGGGINAENAAEYKWSKSCYCYIICIQKWRSKLRKFRQTCKGSR